MQKRDKELLLHFILVVEHLRTISFYKKNPLIKEIVTKIKPACQGILVIFGSYAKGNQNKESDLDLFLAGKYDPKIIRKIGEKYGIEINIKQYPFPLFKKALSGEDHLVQEVIKDHIIISEADTFVLLLIKKWAENHDI